MINPRKDKKLLKIWLTDEEERILLENLKQSQYCEKIIYLIISKAKERGDLE